MIVENFQPPMALQQQWATHAALGKASLLTVQVAVMKGGKLVSSNVTMPVVGSR